MDTAYLDLRSSNLFVEIFKECMPLVVATWLLIAYNRKRINILDLLLYAFATEAYTLMAVGPTFNASFFVGLYLTISQIHQVLSGRLPIRREYMLLLLLPLISQMMVMMVSQLYENPFSVEGSPTAFYIRPIYFYLKNYLPLFAIGSRILQERDTISFEGLVRTMKKIALYSAGIGILQLFVQVVLHNDILGELLGLQQRYMLEQINGPMGVRIQAFFAEPKVFCAFISLTIPFFLRDREYKSAIWVFLMAVQTSSQTFWINMLSAAIVFILLKPIRSVRFKALASLGVIICIFLSIASAKDVLMQYYLKNRNEPISRMLLERSLSRYDTQYWQQDNQILGIPLQRDMELPVVDFLRDHPYLLWTGYGPGNSTFIPGHYFSGLMRYMQQLEGVGGHNLNMRWFYILAEFGMIGLFLFFWLLTRADRQLPSFQRNYLVYVAVCFFFSQIDLFLLIMAMLCQPVPEEEQVHRPLLT
ncbi:O-antigen ligase family protein [Chitinophaga varians]|uniref:O-antigen ligase family protein n=1 Tax=Chitinophaga varians TaxID=2202339 RepID=UPI00165F44D8|nr:O-antigen ligase family protein [Chitinophaga varians]MBC9914810.1 O-antigen ligase family protein [Chitinophaga varians]